IGATSQGFYEGATRFLSQLELRLGNLRPLLLSSTVKNDNTMLTVDLMNRDTGDSSPDTVTLLPGTLHIFRSKFLWNKTCYERLRVTNYGSEPVEVDLSFRFKADFADIFEIRGVKRKERGKSLPVEIGENVVVLSYLGLDGVTRRTRFEFNPSPKLASESEVH